MSNSREIEEIEEIEKEAQNIATTTCSLLLQTACQISLKIAAHLRSRAVRFYDSEFFYIIYNSFSHYNSTFQ